ncbi:MAG: NADP-dependent oxidoreductase [Phycisphaerae bacterium]|nr:NADP-dependent oxidoreductase [Phycisphaerae bacterium]
MFTRLSVAVATLLLAVPMLAMASQTMKAIQRTGYGGPDVLLLADVAKPSAGTGQVLIRVHAAGVNPVDWKMREGGLRGMISEAPAVLGFDVAGTVEAVGDGVTTFKAGDEVFAYIALDRGGGYAEFAAVPAAHVAKKPAAVDFVTAAAVPLAALTAWQALVDKAGMKEGQTVLVHAGAGGVGHFAIQIAKARGAKVIATASKANHNFLKSLGADVVVDYKNEKFEDVAKDVDIVLDSIGGDTQERSLGVLKQGGALISIVQPPDPAKLKERSLRGEVMLVAPNGAQLAELAALIDAGKIKPHVSETFPLAEAAKAQEQSKAGHVRGKIVLKVR